MDTFENFLWLLATLLAVSWLVIMPLKARRDPNHRSLLVTALLWPPIVVLSYACGLSGFDLLWLMPAALIMPAAVSARTVPGLVASVPVAPTLAKSGLAIVPVVLAVAYLTA